jgi:hypothetical protein
MHRRRFVLGRRVNSVQNKRSWARIDELMLSAGGYDDQIAGLDVLVDTVDGRFAFPRRECQDLVDGVFLRAGQSRNTRIACEGNMKPVAQFQKSKEQGAGAIPHHRSLHPQALS